MDPSRKLAKTAAAAGAVSMVLTDDDLLDEILLRVGFPTTLVRAAAVCKRWLHHASDKAFLRRFRKLNPPRLLGFYIKGFRGSPRFTPMLPQPPELAAAVRIVGAYSFAAGNDGVMVKDCRNGSVFTELYEGRHGVHSPLCPHTAMAIDPPIALQPVPRSFQILSREEKGGGLSFFYVMMEFPMEEGATYSMPRKLNARVYMLRDGAWCLHTSATTWISPWRAGLRGVLVDNKIYMLATISHIIVLDLTNSTFSSIPLPQEVACHHSDFKLSRADDASSVYLIRVIEFQIRIWLHKGDSWSIVDTICLHEMCANLVMSEHTPFLWINHVGDNAEFVLFAIGRSVLYLDMRCRTLRTLYKMSKYEHDRSSISIHPFMMIWPPRFPALKCDPTRNAM